MRIYSSLSPLDFHARGAELCRVILLRDADCMQLNTAVFYEPLHSRTNSRSGSIFFDCCWSPPPSFRARSTRT
jgi:hypothetical protein